MVGDLPAQHLVLIIALHQVEEGGDRVQERKEESPEGQDQHADHGIPDQRQDAYHGHDPYGDPHVAAVRTAHLLPVAAVDGGLPDDEDNEYRREQERDGAGREEDGTHQDAHEGQQERRDIDDAGRQGLFPLDADEQGNENGEGEPGELREQPVSHPPVRTSMVRPDEEHSQDEDEDGQDGGQDGPECADPLILHPLEEEDADQPGDKE